MARQPDEQLSGDQIGTLSRLGRSSALIWLVSINQSINRSFDRRGGDMDAWVSIMLMLEWVDHRRAQMSALVWVDWSDRGPWYLAVMLVVMWIIPGTGTVIGFKLSNSINTSRAASAFFWGFKLWSYLWPSTRMWLNWSRTEQDWTVTVTL